MRNLEDLAVSISTTVSAVRDGFAQYERVPFIGAAVRYFAEPDPYIEVKTYGGTFTIYEDGSGYRVSSPYDYGARTMAYKSAEDVLDVIKTELVEYVAESMSLEAADVLAEAEYVILFDDWGGDLPPYVLFNAQYDIWDDGTDTAFTVFIDISDDYPLLSVRWQVPDTGRDLLGRADDMCIGTDYGFVETFDYGVSEKIAEALRNDYV